jgi:hypothetical protein
MWITASPTTLALPPNAPPTDITAFAASVPPSVAPPFVAQPAKSRGVVWVARAKAIQFVLSSGTPFLVALSAALLGLRFRRPRPRFRRLARQPGSVACVMSLAGILVYLICLLSTWAAMGNWDVEPDSLLPIVAATGGYGVVIGWLTLLWTRSSRAEQNWNDRTERLLGRCWILMLLAAYFDYASP